MSSPVCDPIRAISPPRRRVRLWQVLAVGRMYTVGVGDTVLTLARRFGTTPASIAALNYELGALNSSNLTAGQAVCLIANSCLGAVQSDYDRAPAADQVLERWYAGVQAAYAALRQAQAKQLGQAP
jgi:spore germination protein YaaH